MKIAILTTNDISGGAARAAHRLSDGFNLIGIDSKILSKMKTSENPKAYVAEEKFITLNHEIEIYSNNILQKYFDTNRTELSNTIFTSSYPSYDISSHPVIIEADIINIHWVAYFLSPLSIKKLIDMEKIIVWTIHDERALTGGCHYSAGCDNFQIDCKNCPQINYNNSIFPYFDLKQKIDLFNNEITVIGPSKWLAKKAKSSALFKNSRIENIHYSLDTNMFIQYPKNESRRIWDIPENRFVFLFGAESSEEKRKGFAKLLQALKILQNLKLWKEALNANKLHFLLFGPPAKELTDLNIPFTSVGTISNDKLLAQLYSAADIFVLPSLEDNMPYSMMESMSCGTPVVAFRVGGMVDIINENENGYLAEFNDSNSLAEKILDAYLDLEKRIRFGANSAEFVQKECKLEIQAEKYKKIFEDLIRIKNSKQKEINKSNELKNSYSLNQYKNELENELSKWSLKQLDNLSLNYGNDKNFLFIEQNKVYNYSNYLESNSAESFKLVPFRIEFDLKDFTQITGFNWSPGLNSSYEIKNFQLKILYPNSRLIDLTDFHCNGIKKSDSIFFYHIHPQILVQVDIEPNSRIIISGLKRKLNSWESFDGLESQRKKMESEFQSLIQKMKIDTESAVKNLIPYRLGMLIIKPFEWSLSKLKKLSRKKP
jgi:glycosyltransferase involved in cell wall biosynthesis